MKIDKKLIKELSDYLTEFKLTELEYGEDGKKIKVSRNKNPLSYQIDNPVPKNENNVSTDQTNSGKDITSPIIGTAYLAPEPGGKKFTDVGKKIKKGDTVMIVEAMKTMNHVPSPFDGTIKEICVEDGSPVEFGQVIAKIV